MKSMQKGYTLLELLVVIGILSVIGVIVLTVVFVSLRGTQKSDNLELVRQNGDEALSQMVKSIRYAKTLNSPSTCYPPTSSSSITITSLTDGAQTTYSCTGTTISSNSASLVNTNGITVSNCSFTCSQLKATDPPTITIRYSLSAKVANFSESKATIPFESSVTLRNYSQ